MPKLNAQEMAEQERRQIEREREEKRVSAQRNLFTFLPVVPVVEQLKAAMLQRAYDLLWDGRAEECDAILEFVPIRDVEKMLDAWQADQDDTTPPENYSHWYRWGRG